MSAVETLGGELKRLRQQAGLSQQQLHDRSGVSLNTIKSLETGRSASTDPANIGRLADALGVDEETRAVWMDGARWRPKPTDERVGQLEREVAAIRTLLDAQEQQLREILARLPPRDG